jgi:hypothetical protein
MRHHSHSVARTHDHNQPHARYLSLPDHGRYLSLPDHGHDQNRHRLFCVRLAVVRFPCLVCTRT